MTADETDLFGFLALPAVRADPYVHYGRLQASTPVAPAGPDVRFVFGYDDCLTLLTAKAVSVDEHRSSMPATGPEQLPTLLHLDPPDHGRLRRLVSSAFTPRRVEALRGRAAELIAASLDRFGPGDDVDLIAELAHPVPLAIICDLLGIAPADRPLVREWSASMARSIDPDVLRTPELDARIDAAQADFSGAIRALIAERRRSPGDDLLSDLVVTGLGDQLREDELVGLAVLLLVAGHETTVSLIGNGMLALLRHPDQWRAVQHDAGGERRAVDELLRYDPPVQMTSRIALEDVVLPTATIPAGSVAVLVLGAANHDPRRFADPHRLDVRVERARSHLAFGFGIHHCLGAALARAEAEVAIPALVRRFPGMGLLGEPALRPTFVLRGRERLDVRL
jgi:unspecific monooxygenase